MEKELTILLPCLNEKNTIATCIAKGLRFLDDYGIDGEVLVADNGSTDGSIELIRQSPARLVCVSKKGYGSVIIGGIENAHGKCVIMCDSDDSYDMDNLMPFLLKLRGGCDLVMGNRYLGGFEDGAMSFSHYWGVKGLTHLANLVHGTGLGDYHCGLRAFDREKFLKLDLKCSGMEFASEMIIKAHRAGYGICEIPTRLYCDGRDGSAHLNTVRDGFRHLKVIFSRP